MGMSSMQDILAYFMIVVGACALALSGILGAAAWATALRAKIDHSGWVFARGFLGVSAVVCFAIGGAALAGGISTLAFPRAMSAKASVVGTFAAVTLAVFFMAVEFVVAGMLYRRVRQQTGSGWSLFLSVSSFVIAGTLGLGGLAAGTVTALLMAAPA